MTRLLQSPWMTALIGGLLYLGVTAALIQPGHFHLPEKEFVPTLMAPGDDPSWRFRNPEFDQWVLELKAEKESLAQREEQLKALQTRVQAEREELTIVTQTVARMQADFDRGVVRLKEQELPNLKRQAKILTTMSPEGGAAMLKGMQDDDVVKVLFVMKPDEVSQILEALTKAGKDEAKRVAIITDKMRSTLPPLTTVKKSAP